MMKFVRPDIYLSVLDYDTQDFKPSAREFLDRATAVIVHADKSEAIPAWDDVSLKLIAGKPVFPDRTSAIRHAGAGGIYAPAASFSCRAITAQNSVFPA